MRGRQLGTWIGGRGGEGDAAAAVEAENFPSRGLGYWMKRLLPWLLLLTLVIGVGWWIRRESAYNRFVRDLKVQDIQYVEYQPHVNSAFVKVVASTNVQQVISWLGEGRPIDNRYM